MGTTRVALVFGFLAVAGQRFGISSTDGSSLGLTALVLIGVVIWQLAARATRVSPVAVLLFAALITTASLSTVLAPAHEAVRVSWTSLLLFIATYSVVLLRRSGGPQVATGVGVGRIFLTGATAAIKLGALLGIAQFVLQRIGAGFIDPMESIPEKFRLTGYNTYWSLQYQGGVGQFKPNGVIFLEPALLSLYSVLALIVVLGQLFGRLEGGTRRGNIFWALVLSGGLAVSASTSGILVLVAAAIPMALSIRRNRPLVLALFAAVAIALSAGVFDSVIRKANEGFTGRTSSALRLTLPYEILTPIWHQRPLFGWGPGAAASFIDETNILGLQASTLMKLLVEYGLIGACVLALLITYCLFRTGAPLYLTVAIFIAWLLPAEALLNGTLVLLMLFALPNWRTTSAPVQSIRLGNGRAGRVPDQIPSFGPRPRQRSS